MNNSLSAEFSGPFKGHSSLFGPNPASVKRQYVGSRASFEEPANHKAMRRRATHFSEFTVKMQLRLFVQRGE